MSGAVQYFDSDVRKRSTIDIIAHLESKDSDRVYVKQKYLNEFPDCTYWSNPKSKMGVVICCDYMKNPVGLIMPVRANKDRF